MLTDNTDITFTYNSRTNRFTDIYGFTGLLTSLMLQALFFTNITKTYSLKRITLIQTFCMSTNIRQNKYTSRVVTWLQPFTDLETCPQTLVYEVKSSLFKEKEIVARTDCLETSLYNVLRLLHEKFIRLFRKVNVDAIDLVSLKIPSSTRCRESLQKREQTRDPFMRVHP